MQASKLGIRTISSMQALELGVQTFGSIASIGAGYALSILDIPQLYADIGAGYPNFTVYDTSGQIPAWLGRGLNSITGQILN